jgi:hypothetical protein
VRHGCRVRLQESHEDLAKPDCAIFKRKVMFWIPRLSLDPFMWSATTIDCSLSRIVHAISSVIAPISVYLRSKHR